MKITVITATWNSETTIGDTLDSLSSQKYDDVEFILIDGGSTDNTLRVVKNHPVIVHKLVSENDNGIYDALNKGIKLATGDVIGFLHSDDVYFDEMVLNRVAQAFLSSNADAVYGDLDYVSRDGKNKVIRHWKSGDYSRDKILRGWIPPHPSFYMKTNCYKEYGAFNVKYKIAADYDSMLRYFWIKKNKSCLYSKCIS